MLHGDSRKDSTSGLSRLEPFSAHVLRSVQPFGAYVVFVGRPIGPSLAPLSRPLPIPEHWALGSPAPNSAQSESWALPHPQRSYPLRASVQQTHMCGLPVIAANTSGTLEMVDEGVNGMLTNVQNADEFACSISNAMISLDSFSSATISDNAKSEYGSDATCHSYLNLYASML